jgi:hypothetical protein
MRRLIANMKEKKDKLKAFRNKFICKRCGARYDNKPSLEKHKQSNHGEFNHEFVEESKSKPNRLDLSEFEDERYVRPDYSDEEIIWIADFTHVNKGWSVTCRNCLKEWNFKIKPDVEHDLVLCPFCGLNIYKDQRKKAYNWLQKDKNHVLPATMRMDVIMSAIPSTNDGDSKLEIKRVKL